MVSDDRLIAQTREWVSLVVIGDNFCPFARKEMENDTIRYRVIRNQPDDKGLEEGLMALVAECKTLDDKPDIETTLLVYPDFDDFQDFLGLLEMANQLMASQDYEGIYQLASFHPDYCFADTTEDDPANYTNRSPYPTLHLIREASIERALSGIENPGRIPERNIRHARAAGLAAMQAKLNACLKKGDD